MRLQQGFIPIALYAAIGAGVIILGLSIALKVQSSRLEAAQTEKARITGEYEAFKAGVKKIGEEAQAKAKLEIDRQKRVSNETVKSLTERVAASNARADSLCKSAGLSSGCGELSRVPPTARAANEAERDKQLLGVLQSAQEQADRLSELQAWVRNQQP